mmetsp:Transcript_6355/g.10779  ORF Transcript_6355/g.10779 Transcript_6355/m.10779 type:complete len:301 (+) Transcript_6355:726-1628(+)
MRNLALRCRGFLWRNSLKHPNKWNKCFYCFDVHEFLSPRARKLLNVYSMREVVFQDKVPTLRHLKRLRLDADVQLLALPRYRTRKFKVHEEDPRRPGRRITVEREESVLQEYLALVYKNEERVLSDVVYLFKEARDFPPNIQSIILAQLNFKGVLDACVLSEDELEQLQSTKLEADRLAFMKRRKTTRMFLSIFEQDVLVCRIKQKEVVPLLNALVDFDPVVNSSLVENYKHRFRIHVPLGSKTIQQGGKFCTHVVGSSCEEIRKEWVLTLQILQSSKGRLNIRQSMLYLNQQKKISIWN